MANIAQTINVLQAMILTDKEKMILTPTYYVFKCTRFIRTPSCCPTELQSAEYRFGDEHIPAVNVSASRDGAGKIHVTLCNLDPKASATVTCDLLGAKARDLKGQVLTSPTITAHNTFDQPDNVKPTEFHDFKVTDHGFTTTCRPNRSCWWRCSELFRRTRTFRLRRS